MNEPLPDVEPGPIEEAAERFHTEAERLHEALEGLDGDDTKNNRKRARLALASTRIALQEVAELVKGDGK